MDDKKLEREPVLEIDAGEEKEEVKKPLLQISGLPEHEIEPGTKKTERVFMHELTEDGRVPELSDAEFCLKHGEDEDFKKLRREISKRPPAPALLYVRCPECGWRAKVRAGTEIGGCLSCNRMNYADGAKLKVMSDREARKYDEELAELNRQRVKEIERTGKINQQAWAQRIASGEFLDK
jgi:ribosomal protein L37AE/L43A